ncbi:hypothetical protein ACROYT_G039001 [Oculina patagonica]
MWPANLLSPLSVLLSLCAIIIIRILYFAVHSLVDKEHNICVTSMGKQSRRLGFFERYFLTVANDGSNTGYINTVLLLESKVKLDQDLVKKALLMLLERFPLLRMRVTVDKFDQPSFEEMENPGRSLDFVHLNQADATQWLHDFQEQINGAGFNTEQGPLWRVALLREASEDTEQGNRYKNTLLFTFHHVISDALSVLELKNKLVEFLGLLHKGDAFEIKSLPLRVPIESMMKLTSPGIWERFMIASALTLGKLRVLFCKAKPVNLYLLKFPPSRSHSLAQKTYVVPRNLTREETMTLIRCSKANNCTVHGALTAATFLAMSHILDDPETPLTSSFTINIRKECKPKVENEEFGIYCTFSLLQMTVNSSTMRGANFWQFARSCTREVRSLIDSGQHHGALKFFQCVNIPSVLALWRYETHHGLRRELFSLTNVGSLSIDQEEKSPYKFAGSYLATQTAQVCYVFGNNIFTVNERLYWTVEYSPEITAKSQAEDFVDLSLRILKDACAS